MTKALTSPYCLAYRHAYKTHILTKGTNHETPEPVPSQYRIDDWVAGHLRNLTEQALEDERARRADPTARKYKRAS
jgi:hypothetical protein